MPSSALKSRVRLFLTVLLAGLAISAVLALNHMVLPSVLVTVIAGVAGLMTWFSAESLGSEAERLDRELEAARSDESARKGSDGDVQRRADGLAQERRDALHVLGSKLEAQVAGLLDSLTRSSKAMTSSADHMSQSALRRRKAPARFRPSRFRHRRARRRLRRQ